MGFRTSEQGCKTLKAIFAKFSYNVSGYISRKLFNENKNLVDGEKFVRSHKDKHSLIVISLLHKILLLTKETFKYALDMDADSIQKIDEKALAYTSQE